MKVLLYDCDGVLADTEANGHRIAFNQMWQEFGVPWSWSVSAYGEKLKISGGRERMRSLYSDGDFRAVYDVPESREEWGETVAAWHKRKSAIYQSMIASGKIPARAGVKRLAEEALAEGWTLGVCSTSNPESVRAVLRHVMGEETAGRFALLLGGDMVQVKKPDPEIYDRAAQELGAQPGECLVIEDSRNGLVSATRAHMRCLVTVSGYTRDEGFDEAALVVTSLGDPDGERCKVLANRSAAQPSEYITAADLTQILEGA